MKRKPIKIDWDDLEDAFNNQNEELVYYLDLVTGHVVLEGEGEADEYDDDENYERQAAPEPAAGRQDATRLYVEPPGTERKVEWMRVFLDQTDGLDPEVVGRLRRALDSEEPTDEVRAILHESPELRDGWFLFRSERLHQVIGAWLAENDVESTEPAPWARRGNR